jgi:hypothetical protein
MFNRQNSPYIDLFEAQLETVWPTLGIGNQKFLDFLAPLKHYIKTESNLQAFSISKYLEVPDSLAFWLEMLAQSCFLYEHLYLLDKANLDILAHKYPKMPESTKTRFHLSRTYSLQPIQWLQTWVWQMHLKIVTEMPILKPVLQQTFWQKHLLSRVSFQTSFLEEQIILGDLLNGLGNGFGLFEIKIPVLVGFKLSLDMYTKLNLSEKDWHGLDTVLHQISTVFTVLEKSQQQLPEFLYYHKLSENEKEKWWQKSEIERKEISVKDEEVIIAIKNIIEQFDQNLNNDLENLNLPPEFLDFLTELCVWVFKPAVEEN